MKMKKASTAKQPVPAKRKSSALQLGEMRKQTADAPSYRARTCVRVYCVL